MALIKARVAGVPPVLPEVNTERLTRAFPNGGRYVPRTALHRGHTQRPRRNVNRAEETDRRLRQRYPVLRGTVRYDGIVFRLNGVRVTPC